MKNNNQGVTLIELLVVITIMMTMITLVAPLAINTVNKAEAQSEYLSFCATLRNISVKAFVNGSALKVELNKDTLSVLKEASQLSLEYEDDSLKDSLVLSKKYQYLYFNELNIRFNQNGIPSVTAIHFKQKERIKDLNLIALLEN